MKIMTNTVINVHVHVHSDNKKMKHHGFPAAETLMLQTWCQGINTLHFLLLLNTRLRPANSPVIVSRGQIGDPCQLMLFLRFAHGGFPTAVIFLILILLAKRMETNRQQILRGRDTTILRQFQTTRDRDPNKSVFAYINNAPAGYSRAVAVH